MEEQVIVKKVDELVPHPRNDEFFDDITGGKWEDFLESVSTSGVIEPIVISDSNIIVSGHQRVRACKELGIEEVTCKVKHYDNDLLLLKDLIETNIQQRGTVGGSKRKQGRIAQMLELIYGVKHGRTMQAHPSTGEGKTLTNESECAIRTLTSANESAPPTMEELAALMGVSLRQYRAAKRIAELVPDLGEAVDEGQIPTEVASRLVASLSKEDQLALAKQLPGGKLTAAQVQRYVDGIRDANLAKDKAEEALADAQAQVKEATQAAKEAQRQVLAANEKASNLNARLQAAEARASKPPETVVVPPDDYEDLKDKAALVDDLEAELAMLKAKLAEPDEDYDFEEIEARAKRDPHYRNSVGPVETMSPESTHYAHLLQQKFNELKIPLQDCADDPTIVQGFNKYMKPIMLTIFKDTIDKLTAIVGHMEGA